MICRICKSKTRKVFSASLRSKYEVAFFSCPDCEFLQSEEPYWLEEAYARPINLNDTGYLQRNLILSRQMCIFLYLFFAQTDKFVDFAGGYGVFTRLMRDFGFDYYWLDEYSNNLFAEGFNWEKTKGKAAAATAFECFEHFADPINEIKKIIELSDCIIFSTELLPEPVPDPTNWWYYCFEHGQHIAFYSRKTLARIAQKFALNYANSGNLHFFYPGNKFKKWQLLTPRLIKIGFDRLIAMKLQSRTNLDFNVITEAMREKKDRPL